MIINLIILLNLVQEIIIKIFIDLLLIKLKFYFIDN